MFWTESERKAFWDRDQIRFAEVAYNYMCCDVPTVGLCVECGFAPDKCENKMEVGKLQAENTRLRTALEDIANPLQRLKREMPEGVKLNGQMAVALMESPDFYKDIARQELGYE